MPLVVAHDLDVVAFIGYTLAKDHISRLRRWGFSGRAFGAPARAPGPPGRLAVVLAITSVVSARSPRLSPAASFSSPTPDTCSVTWAAVAGLVRRDPAPAGADRPAHVGVPAGGGAGGGRAGGVACGWAGSSSSRGSGGCSSPPTWRRSHGRLRRDRPDRERRVDGGAGGSPKSNLNLRAAFLEVVKRRAGLGGRDRRGRRHRAHRLAARTLASILIGSLIVPLTIKLLRESIDVLMETTPKHIDLASVRAWPFMTPHVHDVHELHVSQVATGLPVLTAHVVVDELQLQRRRPASDAGPDPGLAMTLAAALDDPVRGGGPRRARAPRTRLTPPSRRALLHSPGARKPATTRVWKREARSGDPQRAAYHDRRGRDRGAAFALPPARGDARTGAVRLARLPGSPPSSSILRSGTPATPTSWSSTRRTTSSRAG